MRRITKAALGGVAGCALVLGGTMAAGASTTYRYVDKLGDFSADEGPFDSTNGKVTIVEKDDGSTTFTIKITGIDTSALSPSQEFGAHLHTGECVDGDYANSDINKAAGSRAGPHYNRQLPLDITTAEYNALGSKAPVKAAANEVWFDLVPSAEDDAASFQATALFVPEDLDGTMSIVIHVGENDEWGSAGGRQACFPLEVPTHWKTA